MSDKKYNQLNSAPIPVPSNFLMTFGDPSTGEAQQTTLQNFLDQIGTALQVFYVDGNNVVAGNGSVTNPFQTLEQAITAVLGTGTRDNPQHQNVAVRVSAFSYTTSSNIWMNNVTWYFDEGTIVSFTGADYFVDSSVVTLSQGYFKIKGGLSFRTATGGFIRNEGLQNSATNTLGKFMDVEVYEIISTTALGVTTNPTLSRPVIWLNQIPTGTSFVPVWIILKVQNRFESAFQTLMYQQKGWLYVDGIKQNNFYYGRNGLNFIATGHVQGRVHKFENTDLVGARKYLAAFDFRNMTTIARLSDGVFEWQGEVAYCTVDKISAEDGGLNVLASRWLLLDNFTRATDVYLASTRLMIRQFVQRGRFNNADIIKSIGTTPTIKDLELHSCVMSAPYSVDPNIFIGNHSFSNASVACINVFKSYMHISNLPTYPDNATALAANMVVDDVYKDASGNLKIVY